MKNSENTTDQVIIKLAKPEDAKKLNDFYNESYGENRTLEQWHWLFNQHPNEDGNLIFAYAEFEGKVVGTQGIMPVKFINSEGEVFWTGKSEETLVSPQMRGKNVYGRMYDLIYSLEEVKNYDFIWGFSPAMKAFEKVGFRSNSKTEQIFKAFSPDAIKDVKGLHDSQAKLRDTLISIFLIYFSKIKSLFSFNTNEKLTIQPIREASIEMSVISEKMIKRYGGFTIDRSANYINWRFINNPFSKPKIIGAFDEDTLIGFLVYGTNNNVSAIVDLVIDPTTQFKPEEIITSLVKFAEEDVELSGSSIIRSWYMGGHHFSDIIKKTLVRRGWVYSKRGFDMVMKDQSLKNVKNTNIENIYVSRAFSQGSIF